MRKASERDPRTGYPCFVKPIKGAFSIMSGKVRSRAELDAFLDRPAAQDFLAEYVLVFNPRLCGQFADLYAKVDGTSGYEVALAVAAGDPVAVPRGQGTARMASSFPLRSFRPAIVRRAPDAAAVSAAERLHPGTLIWMECCEGSELTDFEAEDGWSCRYAV
ncbi:MAG: hypothetical protein ACR2GQ_07385, partial [Gemmatimonadota bacterium]